MTRRQIFIRGIGAGLLLGLVGQAINWLFSAHPDASEARRVGVIAQAVLCALGAVWLARGIPGEPAPSTLTPNAAPRAPEALRDGGWGDAPVGNSADTPSTVAVNRSR